MTGKNKIERGFRFYYDDSSGSARDLSGDLIPGSCKGGGITYDEADMTGVSNTVKNSLANLGNAPITAQFHMNDTATTGAYTVLSATSGSVGTLTLQWGSNGAAPTTGNPEWEGEYTLLGFTTSFTGGRAVMDASFVPGTSTAPAWGTV